MWRDRFVCIGMVQQTFFSSHHVPGAVLSFLHSHNPLINLMKSVLKDKRTVAQQRSAVSPRLYPVSEL